jgi:hypothetical protein
VFGWVHFRLEGDRGDRACIFGFPTRLMDGRSIRACFTFHALDFTRPRPIPTDSRRKSNKKALIPFIFWKSRLFWTYAVALFDAPVKSYF